MIAENLMYALSWTFVHTMWQGIIIGVIVFFMISNTSSAEADKRHRYLLSGLVMLLIAAIATFIFYLPGSTDTGGSGDTGIGQLSLYIQVSALDNHFSLASWINQHTHAISRVWLVGVLLFSLRFLYQFSQLKYLTNINTRLQLPEIQRLGSNIAQLMGISKEIKVFASRRISTPMTTGWLKPMILIPIGLVNQLTTAEVESILAHELAHIKRNDWLINLFQSIMEVVFFYHPIVWIVSHKMREERENSCDDLACQHRNNKLDYAKLLVKIKQWQLDTPVLAMGMAGKQNVLLRRIKRLLEQPKKTHYMKEKVVASAIVLCVAVGFAFTKIEKEALDIPFLSSEDIKLEEKRDIQLSQLATQPALVDTMPTKRRDESSITIQENDQRIEIEKENGKIISMKVNGKEVDPEDYDKYDMEMENFNFDKRGDAFIFRFGDDEEEIFNFDSWDMGEGDFHFDIDSMLRENFRHFDEENSFMFAFPENFDSLMMRGFGDRGLYSFNEENIEKLKKLMEEGFGGEGFAMPDIQMFRFDGMEDFPFENMEENWMIPYKRGTVSDKIGREMSADGLLNIGEENTIELTGKHLKINGKKQPDHLWEKYKDLWQDYSGVDMTKDSKVEFKIEGKKSRKKGLRRI